MRFAIDHVLSYLSRTVFNPWLLLTLVPRMLMEADSQVFTQPLSPQTPKLLFLALYSFLTNFNSALLAIPPFIGLLFKLNECMNFWWVDSGIKDKYDWPKEIAVVTGGSGATGSATIRNMLKMGVGKVVILDVMDPQLDLIKGTLHGSQFDAPKADGVMVIDERVSFYRCDVSEYINVQKTAHRVKQEIGSPTILVLAAGIMHPATLISGNAYNIEK